MGGQIDLPKRRDNMATGKRMVSDCRLIPSEKNCSLYIAGTEDEVLAVAVRHAINEHGHADTPGLRQEIRGMMKEEAPGR
jgi:hypothetical protein